LILVDTNVLVDIISDDPVWAKWSQRHLALAATRDEVAINDIVYAELSIRYTKIEELDAMLDQARLSSARIPRPALFLAGKAFQRYRAAGGSRTGGCPTSLSARTLSSPIPCSSPAMPPGTELTFQALT
jgi:predicted nucleic acid-binding protein